MLSSRDIQNGLVQLGLRDGDRVLVHSSLKSFGQVADGANAVIDAILRIVGERGALLVPTNTFTGSVTVFLRQTTTVDLRSAPSLMGKITETLRQRDGAIRSIHPTHPVAGLGSAAGPLLANHHISDTPCGKLSPYGKLARDRAGRILLLGVSTEAMTLLHTAEEYFAPYMFVGEQFKVSTTALDGAVHQVTVKGYCVNRPRNFTAIDPVLEAAGVVRKTEIGACNATLIDASAVVPLCQLKLLENPEFLLGGNAQI